MICRNDLATASHNENGGFLKEKMKNEEHTFNTRNGVNATAYGFAVGKYIPQLPTIKVGRVIVAR